MEKQSQTRVDAVERLEVAREEQERRVEQHEAASGSPKELPTLVKLQAAEEQFAAREAWLQWTERDH